LIILSLVARPSSRGILSPSPLACLYDFAQIRNRPYLNRSKSRFKLHSMRAKP
jgi:hypothetical protein